MRIFFDMYAGFIRKYINKPRDISLMHSELRQGYEEFRKRKHTVRFSLDNMDYIMEKHETPVFRPGDDLIAYITSNIEKHHEMDIITVAESVIAITQSRAYRLDEIRVSNWAMLLYPWVSNVTYGTGLGMAETMQCAIEEAGLRIILQATLKGALDRIRGKHGGFYSIAGPDVKSIDFKKQHPVEFKGSHNYIVLSPASPVSFCRIIHEKTGMRCAVVDANNVSVDIMAVYPLNAKLKDFIYHCMRGNPAGQEDEKTPIVILRFRGNEKQ
ncbi:MAG: coenzyme F420-0:L-glutamate ligase [candidate division WOR-3 bacterium]|nr:coenzyme F420-0:L-glutamate ligase [candidate division WOR-3 bacterium]